MTEAKEMLETAIADKGMSRMSDTLDKFILDANILEIMERDYSV